jgi:hypothetical protein
MLTQEKERLCRVHADAPPARFPRWRLSGVAAAALLAAQAQAMEFDTGNPNLSLRWDNTVRYGAAFRLKKQNPALLGNANNDDGDRNFNKGLISNRIDVLSELDVAYKKQFGARISAAGWYDSVYNTENDNPGFAGGAFPNQTSVPFNRFTAETRRLHGRKGELRDAFVFGRVDLAGRPLTVRLGSHALVWGESLFFAGNAIAGAQGPFDISRLVADPTAQAKEFVLPVPQVSGQLQVSPDVSIGAYYQFRWKPSRLPAVGSYFSRTDTNVDGAERLWLVPGARDAPREANLEPKDSGQFGVQLRWRLEETDLGFYALRYHDKFFQQVTRLGPRSLFGEPLHILPASYYLTWPQNSEAYGFSASHTFGDANVAFEASIRRKQALSSNAVDLSRVPTPVPGVFAGARTNNTDNPGYAVGNTGHVNVSTIWTLPTTPLWREASFVGELAWTRLLSCTLRCAARDPSATRDAVAMRMVLTPTYRQVLPALDIEVPIGLGYVPAGSRNAVTPGAGDNTGDITLGLNAVYENTWRFNLSLTHYFGPAGAFTNAQGQYTYRQSLKDRDFVSLSVRRTF